MNRGLLLGGLIGAFLMLYLLHAVGWYDVTSAFASAGYGLLWLPMLHVLVTVSNAQAWRWLNEGRCRLGSYLGARLLREAVNDLLPVANLGGNVAGVYALMRAGLAPVLAVAGVLADMTLEMAAQLAFTMLGLLLLIVHTGQINMVTASALVGSLLLAIGLGAFLYAQQRGLLPWLQAWIEHLASTLGWASVGQFEGLHARVQAIYRDRHLLARSFMLHFFGWLGTVVETWVAFRLLGLDNGVVAALILESLGQAIRSAAFMVPGALGVQEGGYIALGSVLGISAEWAIALSLLRRSREILLGLPVILARTLYARSHRPKA
jgi:putative membrane protein